MAPQAASRWLVLVFAIAQIVAPVLPSLGYGRPVGAASEPVTTPATPAGYAFSIWGLIFILGLAFAVYQLRRPNEPRIDAVRLPLGLAFAANTAWQLWVQFGRIDWVSVAIIVAGAVAALTALLRLTPHRLNPFSAEGALVQWPTGLLAGWLTVAAFANFAAASAGAGVRPLTLDNNVLAVVLIAKAGALAAIFTWLSRGDLGYALAAAWGLAAVIVANNAEGSPTMAAGVGLALVAAVLVLGRRRSRGSALPA